jgi:predicted DNA-binding transcriptional regulator AlpA
MPHTQDEPPKLAAARSKRLQQTEHARKNRELTEDQKKKKRSEARRNRREQLQSEIANQPINPDYVYRTSKFGPKFFGFKDAALFEAIKKGIVPRPFPLSDDGRATGWFGRTILEWQKEREEAARKQQAEVAES